MNHSSIRMAALLVASLATPAFLLAEPPAGPALSADSKPEPIYAQRLADRTVHTHPGMLDLIFHVTPPGSAENITIASFTDKERGQKSGEDDLGVVNGGQPLVEVQKDGVRVGIVVQLKDKAGMVIGALGAVYTYKTGEDPQMYLHKTEHLRDRLAKHISTRDALFATAG